MANYQSGLSSATNQNTSTGTNAQASTTSSGLTDPYAQQALQNSIARTQATASGPNYYASIGPMQTAGLNSYQTQAGAGLSGIAGYKPQQATAGTLNGNNLQGYMNPYVNSVVKSQVALENQQDGQQQQQLMGNAAQAGAFGGDRATLAQTNLAGQQALANNATNAGLYSAGFTQAQNTAEADLNRNLSAQQGNQFAGLQAAGLNLSANQGLAGLGATQNQLDQNADTANYQAQINAAQLPYQQNQYQTDNLNSLLRYAGTTGTTANSGNTTQDSSGAAARVNSQPEPSGTSQVLGAGLGLARLGANTLGSQALSGLGNSLWNGVSGLFGSSTPADTYDAGTDLGILTVARGGRVQRGLAGYADGGSVSNPFLASMLSDHGNGGANGNQISVQRGLAGYGSNVRSGYAQGGLVGLADGGSADDGDDTFVPIGPDVDRLIAGLRATAATENAELLADTSVGDPGPTSTPAPASGLAALASEPQPAPPAPGGPSIPATTPPPGGLAGLAAAQPPGPPPSPSPPQAAAVSGLSSFMAGAQPVGGSQAAATDPAAPSPSGGSGWGDTLLHAGLAIMGGSSPFALQNIGQGALAGIQSANQQREQNAQLALQQQQLRGSTMNNDLQQAILPNQIAQIKAMQSGLGTTGGSGYGPAQVLQEAELARVRGDSKTYAAAMDTYRSMVGPGGMTDAQGNAVPVPGSLNTLSARTGTEANAGIPAYGAKAAIDTSQTGPRSYASSQAVLPADATRASIDTNAAIKKWSQTEGIKPTTMTIPDGRGGFVEQNVTANQAAATLAGSSGTPITDPASALATVPTNFRTPFVNALVKNGIPPSAWPVAVAMAGQESSWNPNTPGGLGSVLPDTAKGEGFDPTKLNDPATGLDAMMHHYAVTLKQAGGDPIQAGILYNNGGDPTKGDPNYGASLVARLNGATRGVGSGSVTASNGSMPGIPGKPFYTPEQTKVSEAYGDAAKGIIDAGLKAPTALQRLDVIDTAAQGFRPGASGDVRLAAAKGITDTLQSLGIDPPDWLKNGAAAGETINKEGGFLATELTRSLGSREALGVFNAVRSIMPNIELSNGGFQVVTNSLRQGVLRDQDLANYQEKWLAPKSQGGMGNSSIAGMETQFEKDHPVQAYASRIVPYPMPKSASSAIPNTIYTTARGPALWDGQKFTVVN